MTSSANVRMASDIARVPPTELVLVVGSGVSCAPPSNLPTGGHLRAQLLRDLMRCAAKVLTPVDHQRLEDAVVGSSIPDGAGGKAPVFGIPFEGLLDIHRQLYPASNKVAAFLEDNLTGGTPNPVHEFLAASMLASPPVFPRVVTLNYDELIEKARPHPLWRTVRVTSEADRRAWRDAGTESLLFKLHGSFHASDTIVATLSTEHGLAGWKKEFLREIVAGKVLLMVGYSGYDFDVCPVLLDAEPKRIYWNTLEPNDEFPEDAQELLDRVGHQIFGDAADLFEAIRKNLPSASSLPAIARCAGGRPVTRAMSLSEEEALAWLTRVAVEVGAGDLGLKLVQERRTGYRGAKDDFSLLRDEARAHFLLDHTPVELNICKGLYRRALKCATSPLEAADIWINYHEPCRLELKYTPGKLRKVVSLVGMFRALLSAGWHTLWRRANGVARLRGYIWLRWAQVLENLVRQTRLSKWSWPRELGYALTRWCLSRARDLFASDDNYFGTLQAQRILLRVSSAPQIEQLKSAKSMRDYYRRLGYLTAWSNSNRDMIDVMRKDHPDIAGARRLAREALEVSTLAGDRPGVVKAKQLLTELV